MAILSQTFASKSNPDLTYTTTLDTESGVASCTCPGFLKRCVNGHRECTHTKQLAETAIRTAVKAFSVVKSTEPLAGDGKSITTPVLPFIAPKPVSDCPFIPMLASAMTKGQTLASFASAAFIAEEKFDGYRVIVKKTAGKVECWSRPRAGDVAKRRMLPDHLRAACLLLADGVYDGELLVPGGKSFDVTRVDRQKELVLVFYDILACGTEMLKATGETFTVRRELLHAATTAVDEQWIRVPDTFPVTEDGIQAIFDKGGEGAIIKRTTATYREGARSADWIKVKRLGAMTLTVIGFEAGSFGPYAKLLLRRDSDGMETSVKTKNHAELKAIAANPDYFIGRRAVIAYTELTPDGKPRHGRFDHWAGDAE